MIEKLAVHSNAVSESLEEIKFPQWWKTALCILTAIVLAKAAIYFDGARTLAYGVIPVIIFSYWCRNANIKWAVSKKAVIVAYSVGFSWFVAWQLFVSQIISVESGDPIVKSGIIYQLSVFFSQ